MRGYNTEDKKKVKKKKKKTYYRFFFSDNFLTEMILKIGTPE